VYINCGVATNGCWEQQNDFVRHQICRLTAVQCISFTQGYTGEAPLANPQILMEILKNFGIWKYGKPTVEWDVKPYYTHTDGNMNPTCSCTRKLSVQFNNARWMWLRTGHAPVHSNESRGSGQLSLPSSGVGKWVPASAEKAKAGMVHSVGGWTRRVQVKLRSLENACHTWTP